MNELEQTLKRKIIIIGLALFTGAVLLSSVEDANWLVEQTFAIIVSLLFFSPVIDSVIELRPPREYIVVFILGGVTFGLFCLIYYESLFEVIVLIFKIILFSTIATVAGWAVSFLEDNIPP